MHVKNVEILCTLCNSADCFEKKIEKLRSQIDVIVANAQLIENESELL